MLLKTFPDPFTQQLVRTAAQHTSCTTAGAEEALPGAAGEAPAHRLHPGATGRQVAGVAVTAEGLVQTWLQQHPAPTRLLCEPLQHLLPKSHAVFAAGARSSVICKCIKNNVMRL